RVLDLDKENIIALKSLSEIAERQGNTDAARRWLTRLLVVDGMNSEAEADLQRLGGPLADTEERAAEPAAPALEISFADEPAAAAPPPVEAAPLPAAPAAVPSDTADDDAHVGTGQVPAITMIEEPQPALELS